jgi:transcription elongation factor Elf1
VDVYADWVDACDAVAKEGGGEGGEFAPARGPVAAGRPAARHRSDDEDDVDGLIDDDGMSGGEGYGGEGVVADDEEY